MTTNTSHRLTPEQVKEIRAVVATAEEMGCQLQPSPARPSILKGLCPFHQITPNGDRQSLEVNTDTGRFYCNACGAQGNPMAFLALVWGVSAQDAHILFEANPEARSQRPPYPDSFYVTEGDRPRPQNTALLSKAAAHYGEQLWLHYEALTFLSHLGVHPKKAQAAGIGYCPGGTLEECLRDDAIPPILTPREMDDTQLLHPVNRHEVMTGRIIITDQDYLGATLWLTSMRPDTASDEADHWGQDRPSTYGISGARQYLLNNYAIDRQRGLAILTDDARVYILMASNNLPVALLTQRRRPDTDLKDIAERTANALRRRQVKKLVIINHDLPLRRMLQQQLTPDLGAENIATYTKDQLLQTLEKKGRDLSIFTDWDKAQPEAAPGRSARNNGSRPEADIAETVPDQPQEPETPANETAETPAAAAGTARRSGRGGRGRRSQSTEGDLETTPAAAAETQDESAAEAPKAAQTQLEETPEPPAPVAPPEPDQNPTPEPPAAEAPTAPEETKEPALAAS